MKIRESLNTELFTEDNVDELLITLKRLRGNFDTFIDGDVDGGEIAGIFLKDLCDKLTSNPIFKSILDYEKVS